MSPQFNRTVENGKDCRRWSGELSKAAKRNAAQQVATMREPDRVTVVNGAAEAISAKTAAPEEIVLEGLEFLNGWSWAD